VRAVKTMGAIVFLLFFLVSPILSWEGPYPLWNDGNPKTIESVAGFFISKGQPIVFLVSAQPMMYPGDEFRVPAYLQFAWKDDSWIGPDSLHVPLEPYGAGRLLIDAKGRTWFLWQLVIGKEENPGVILASRRMGDSWSEPELIYEANPDVEFISYAWSVSDSRGRIWCFVHHRWAHTTKPRNCRIWAFVREESGWIGPIMVADESVDNVAPYAEADDSGGVWVVWKRENSDGEYSLWTRYLTIDLLTSEVMIPLPDSSRLSINAPVTVTVDDRGDPWYGFILYYHDDPVATVITYSGDIGWHEPWILGTHEYSDYMDTGCKVVRGNDGEMWCLWTTRPVLWYYGFCGNITLARFDGEWSDPEIVVPDYMNSFPAIRIDENNRVWLCWYRWKEVGQPGEFYTTWYAWNDYPTSIEPEEPEIYLPSKMSLSQNYPNPFNPLTAITFTLPEGAEGAELSVYDVRGRRVRSLSLGDRSPGTQTVVWDGRDDHGRPVPSGTYFARLTVGGKSLTRKMVLLR